MPRRTTAGSWGTTRRRSRGSGSSASARTRPPGASGRADARRRSMPRATPTSRPGTARGTAPATSAIHCSSSAFSRVRHDASSITSRPANETALYSDDDDLSGSGFTILPGSNLLLGGGKEGVLYLLDGASRAQTANDAQIVQRIPVNGGHVMGGPVFWNSAAAGPLVYNWSEDDVLRSYKVSGGRLVTPAYAQGGWCRLDIRGDRSPCRPTARRQGTGIVWASMPTSQDGVHGPRGRHPARLRRRDAAGDLDERAERRPRSGRHADEVRSSGRRQRQGLHAEPRRGGGGVRPPAGAGG